MKWLWLSVLTVILDQLSKNVAEAELILHRPVAVFPGFNLTLMYNKGAAFSFLSDADGWQRLLFVGLSTGISIFLFIWLWQVCRDEAQKHNHLLQAAITLVLGGAIGNLIDRAMSGEVVDFIQVYYAQWYFPTFNIADSAITLGAGLLILDMIRETKHSRGKSGDEVSGG